jgi:hypothetical protein
MTFPTTLAPGAAFDPSDDDPKQRRPDISRAEAKLGWRPTMRLRNGLVTIAYFENLMRSADGPNEIGASRRSPVGRAGA